MGNLCAQTSNYRFSNVLSNNAFSINSVQDIIQDSHGYIWIGTPNGILRYDGYDFLHLTNDKNDPNSLSDNFINVMYKESRGNIWVGTNGGGLNKLNMKDNTFTQIILDPKDSTGNSQNISAIEEYKNGNLLVGTNGAGLYKISYNNNVISQLSLNQSKGNSPNGLIIISLFIDSENVIYAGTEGDGVHILNLKQNQLSQIAGLEGKDVSDIISYKNKII